MGIRSHPIDLILIVLLGGIVAGCGDPPNRSGNHPALPAGFGALVPNADFQLYSYVNQGTPFVFQPGEESLGLENVPGLPTEARVDSLAFWAAFTGEEPVLGIRADFQDSRMIPFIMDAFQQDGEALMIWFLQQGDVLNVVIGQGPDAEAFQRVAEEEDFLALEEARPAVWNSILALPEDPPVSPVGVGYADIADETITQLIGMAQETLGEGAQALERLKPLVERTGIQHSVFALYGPQLPPIRGQLNLEDLEAQTFFGLVLLDSNIPDFILSFIFGVVLAGTGLDQVDVDGQTAYAPPVEDVAALLKNAGSTIVIAVAMEQEDALAILATVDI